jgi:hypothetical protein
MKTFEAGICHTGKHDKGQTDCLTKQSCGYLVRGAVIVLVGTISPNRDLYHPIHAFGSVTSNGNSVDGHFPTTPNVT